LKQHRPQWLIPKPLTPANALLASPSKDHPPLFLTHRPAMTLVTRSAAHGIFHQDGDDELRPYLMQGLPQGPWGCYNTARSLMDVRVSVCSWISNLSLSSWTAAKPQRNSATGGRFERNTQINRPRMALTIIRVVGSF